MPKQEPREQVQQIPLSEIHPFRDHPFKVLDDELMQQTIDSIMQVGILNPAIIRPDPEGGYEMVAGHRRLHAADLAGLKTIPAIVRNLTDDEAVILMVDSNLQRETISPMERAQAYKMKLEALKHQGKKVELQTDSTSPQLGEKSSWAVSIVANDANASRSQVQRFIRLTELLPEVQEKVESKEIAFSPAVELSYLTHDEQRQFLDAMDQMGFVIDQSGKYPKIKQVGNERFVRFKSLGEGYEVNINEVLKNNSTRLTGLTIKTEESNVAPTIYLEGSFERYKAGDATLPVIVSEIISVYESHKTTMSFDASLVTDFSACKERICYKLVNADRNRELLSDAPHIIVCDDLAVIFYILVSNDGEGTATITVRNNMSDLWGVATDELFKIALANTQRLFRGTVKSMASVMMELLADRLDEEGCREFYDMVVSEDDVPMTAWLPVFFIFILDIVSKYIYNLL